MAELDIRTREISRSVLYALSDAAVEGSPKSVDSPPSPALASIRDRVFRDAVKSVSDMHLRLCVCQIPDEDVKRRVQAMELAEEIVTRLLDSKRIHLGVECVE